MIVSESPVEIKRLRRSPPLFQRTFRTPLKDVKNFVGTIVSAGKIRGGSLTINQEVFEPTHLIACLDRYSITRDMRRLTLVATEPSEVNALLQAVLSDWLDFVFLPEPKSFLIYADHDEYTTFFAHSRSNLNRIVKALLDRGFAPVEYRRPFLG